MANFILRPFYPQERTPFPMEDGAAWVPEAVGTLRKIEKSLEDAMKRKTISFLCKPQHCHSIEYVIPNSEMFYFTSIWFKNMFPDRNFEENKSFEKGQSLGGRMTLTAEIPLETVSCIRVVQEGLKRQSL